MFKTSESTAKLDAALAKAQVELKPAVKDKQNPHFRSDYLTLAGAVESAREALGKHGISVTQWLLDSSDNRVHLITRVACSGEWMQSEFSVPVTKQDAQGFGSAATYVRRFAFMAALGIAPEDDDGNASVGHQYVSPQVVNKSEPRATVSAPRVTVSAIGEAFTEPAKTSEGPRIAKGVHAGKLVSELSFDEAGEYFTQIKEELKAINRDPSTLRGASREIYCALQTMVGGLSK